MKNYGTCNQGAASNLDMVMYQLRITYHINNDIYIDQPMPNYVIDWHLDQSGNDELTELCPVFLLMFLSRFC